MLLATIVSTSQRVAATSSRRDKTAALADTLAELEIAEIETAVGFLVGEPRQGRIGVGWATLAPLTPPSADRSTLSLADVDSRLDDLAALEGPGSGDQRARLLTDLLTRATPQEDQFIRRLLGGELRQGALAGVMTDAVARAAGVPASAVRRAAMLSGDLGRAAHLALTEGRPALDRVGLELLRPVQPMLASTADSVRSAVEEIGRASVEWKLDGIRVQVHRRGRDVAIFTRNLNEVTDRLPEVVEMVRGLSPDRFVLDGETIGLTDDAGPRRFQDTASRFGRENPDDHEYRLEALFFDLLHLDGTDLLDDPLEDRRQALSELVGRHVVPGIITDDGTEAEEMLDEALARGHEGVMVKAADSLYHAGRRGKSWRKVKPVKTLDLVVIAVEWGSGRRLGKLSNIHMGARDAETGEFVMVGKTFKGMTDQMLAWQTERFTDLKTHEEGHVVHVRPEQVVEIALDGVQSSTRYPGGVALRFARVKGYRPDKSSGDADTIDTVRAMLTGG